MKLREKNNDKCNNEKKNNSNWTSAKPQLVHYNHYRRETNGKRIKRKDRINPSLKKSSIGWGLPHTNNSGRL